MVCVHGMVLEVPGALFGVRSARVEKCPGASDALGLRQTTSWGWRRVSGMCRMRSSARGACMHGPHVRGMKEGSGGRPMKCCLV